MAQGELVLVGCAMRAMSKMVALVIVINACGGSTAVEAGDSKAPTTSVNGVTSSVAGVSGTETDPTGQSSEVPDEVGSNPDRATGTGVVTVDDESFDVEVIACGWQPGLSSEPLETEENDRNELRLVAIARVGDDGFFALEVSHDPLIPLLVVSVVRLVPSEEDGNYWWSNDRQLPRWVERDGNRVWTPEPLTVLEDTVDRFSDPHAVTFDVTCDTYGGAMGNIVEMAAEATGLPFVEPTFDAAGTVAFAGETYEITTTSCEQNGGDYSLVADSADGTLMLVLTVSPLPDKIFVKVDGERLVNNGGEEIVVDGDVLSSPGPIPLVGQLSGEAAGDVTFEVVCG